MSKHTATIVGWYFYCKDSPEQNYLLTDKPDFGPHLSPDRWAREPVYRLSPLPVVTVEVEDAA